MMQPAASPRYRAFTLMEVMLSMSVGAIIAAGATFGMVTVFKSTVALEKQSQVDQDAKLILDSMLGQVQELGGGIFRPNDMIYIDDNNDTNCATGSTVGSVTIPACDGSDRLSFIVLNDAMPQCNLRETSPTNGVNVHFDPDSECCNGGGSALAGSNVIMIDRDSGHFENRRCNVFNDSGPNCRCNMPPGQSAYNPPGGVGNDDFDMIAGGYGATIYLDQTDHVLMMLADIDGDGTSEAHRLAPNVWDFQVAYGFDTDNDGEVDTTQTDFTGITDRQSLRLVKIGLVVGARVSSKTTASTAQVLNGDVQSEASGYLLRGVVGATSLRNLFLFY